MQGSVPLPDFFGHQGYHQRMNYLNKPSYFFTYSHKLTRSAKPLTITMVCLIGNSLICIAVYRNARLRSSTNLYIVSLAISDIINAVIVMPFIVDVLITGKWPFGEAVCDFHAFFTLFSVYVSPTTMGLTAFNRYVRIVKPQHYPRIFTDTRSKIYIAAVWLTVAGYISIPKMAGLTEYRFFAGYAACIVEQPTIAMKIVHCIIVVCFFVLFHSELH